MFSLSVVLASASILLGLLLSSNVVLSQGINGAPLSNNLTLRAIDIDRNNVTRVRHSYENLIANVNLSENSTLLNGGLWLTVYSNANTTSIYLYCGFLNQTVYRFQLIRYVWTNNVKGHSGITFNGQGTPLELNIWYYDYKKYQSFENATKYDYAVCIIRIPVKLVDSPPNLRYSNFGNLLPRVKEPLVRVTAPFSDLFSPFITSFQYQHYYLYSGEYRYANSSEPRFSLASVIVIPLEYAASITYCQFMKGFQSLINSTGGPLMPASMSSQQSTQRVKLVEGRLSISVKSFNSRCIQRFSLVQEGTGIEFPSSYSQKKSV